jgi:hypothetical protein
MPTPVLKDNVAPLSGRGRTVDDLRSRPGLPTPLPLGLCILIWTVLAAVGWLLAYLVLRVI